ncbi:MAG: exodeoxyribonuclease VII large subunit [Gemmatimonadaceae bacterium]
MTRRARTVGGDPALDLFGFADVPSPEPTPEPEPEPEPELERARERSRRRTARSSAAAPGEEPAARTRRGARVAEAPGGVPLEHSIPGASPESAVSVATLTHTAKDVLEGAFVPLWVRGEVSDFKSHRNGHWYFTLRDGAAQLRCVVWSRERRRIPAPPDDGMEIVALGQVTVYPGRGDLQLSVVAMEAQGDGLWRKALELTLAALQADGLLAPERKRPLPRFPRRVAVVTSPDGAALHDIVAVARRRWAAVEIVVVPAKVQGEGAPEELCAALERVGRLPEVDVVVVGRGGGAREDLWAFNDERVARAIAGCPVPTISAVGHEVDVTLADLVADARAATPSAAAEAAVPVHAEVAAQVRALGAALHAATRRQLADRRDSLLLAGRDLQVAGDRVVERRRARLEQTAGRLDVLSPLATLGRGYAVARGVEGETLGSTRDFAPGMDFTLLLRDGNVRARAESVERGGGRRAAKPGKPGKSGKPGGPRSGSPYTESA